VVGIRAAITAVAREFASVTGARATDEATFVISERSSFVL
jgi:hypothetical protein